VSGDRIDWATPNEVALPTERRQGDRKEIARRLAAKGMTPIWGRDFERGARAEREPAVDGADVR